MSKNKRSRRYPSHKYVWVNVYTVRRLYGGPEEGGWYYDHYTCVYSKRVKKRFASQCKDNLIKEHSYRKWGNISSVLGGQNVDVWIENHEAESATTERPYYS